jgi:hypothetical protein
MDKEIKPAVGIAIGIVVAILVGIISFKMFGKPGDSVQGKIPAMYSNPGSANQPEPAGAVKSGGAPGIKM